MTATTRIKRVASLRAGGTPSVDDSVMWSDSDNGIPWVAIGDMTRSPIVIETDRRVSPAGIADKRLPVGGPGTLLFAMYASVGEVAVLGTTACWNQAILGIDPHLGCSDSRFLRYWLEHLRPEFRAITRSNTQDNLNAQQVGDLPFPPLPIAHQRAIADYLDRETARIDALIEKKRRMVELFKERHQTLITDTVTNGITGHGSQPSRSVSGGDGVSWTSMPLRRLFSSVVGGSWGSDPDGGADEIILPCVRGTDFDYWRLRTKVDKAPLRAFSVADIARRSAHQGDLIIEKSGGSDQQPVGRVVLHDMEEAVMPTNFAGRLSPAPDVDGRFVCYVLASLYTDGRTRAAIKQTTGIQNLDLDELLSTHVSGPAFRNSTPSLTSLTARPPASIR